MSSNLQNKQKDKIDLPRTLTRKQGRNMVSFADYNSLISSEKIHECRHDYDL